MQSDKFGLNNIPYALPDQAFSGLLAFLQLMQNQRALTSCEQIALVNAVHTLQALLHKRLI